MSPHRRKNEKGIAEAREALAAADRDLQAARSRWPAIRALRGESRAVAAEARSQRVKNHLGDLFATALGEG